MTQSELNGFHVILAAKRADLVRAAARREGIAIERMPDALDEVSSAAERELTTRNLERNSGLLRHVDAALGRIAEAGYGRCLECEEEISHKRFQAMPWAALCIACQEQADGARLVAKAA